MRALEYFAGHGVHFELQSDDAIRAIGWLDDRLRENIKAQKAAIIHELQWQEFDALLAIVAPAYNTPAHEYVEIRAAAADDLQAAIVAFRKLADESQRFLSPRPSAVKQPSR
jgi:hypothetical protein